MREHVVAGDNSYICGFLHKQIQHTGGNTAGLDHVLADIAEDVIKKQFRIDDDYGNLPVEKLLDRLCDSLGADRKNDGAGDIFFGQAADAFYLRLGVGRAELVVLDLDIKAQKILTYDLNPFFDVGRGTYPGQNNGDLHFSLLVIQSLGQRVGFVSILFQKLFDFLAFFLADARPVVDDLVDSGFGRARHICNLL